MPGLGERGHVDGHVGLVEHLGRRSSAASWLSARSPSRVWSRSHGRLTVTGLTASVVGTSRWAASAAAMVGRAAGRSPARRRRPAGGRPSPTAPRLLIGEEGGEAGERGGRALAHERDRRRGRRRRTRPVSGVQPRTSVGLPGAAGARARSAGRLASVVGQDGDAGRRRSAPPVAPGVDGDVGDVRSGAVVRRARRSPAAAARGRRQRAVEGQAHVQPAGRARGRRRRRARC